MVNCGDLIILFKIGLALFFSTCAIVPNAVLLVTSAAELNYTLDPPMMQDKYSLGNAFASQSLVAQSKFPFVSRNGEIYLTQDPTDGTHDSTLYNVGRVMCRNPIRIKDEQNQIVSFSSYLRFSITTTTKYNESGDGIAFVMTTDKQIPLNSTGRFLGLMPEQRVDRHERFFAVEFDTFQNLQAEIADPSASHVGIDINNLSSITYLNTASESHPLYLYHNYTFGVWIGYNASTHNISVWATNGSDSARRPPKPVLTCQYNLSQVFENFTDIYVAVNAASGNNSQAAILYEWSFSLSRNDPAHHLHIWFFPVLGICIFLLVLFAACICCRLWRRSVKRQRNERAAIEMASSCGVRRYKYRDLSKATHRFSEQSRIGSGGFSTVYKGVLGDNTQVAVKRMRDCGAARMEAHIIAREVQIISRIRHRNLLQLRGWCYERGEALLVYDYMPRGSLDSYLYGEKRRSAGEVMDGETRFKVLVGAAAALEYLHGDVPGSYRVLHRDVKAANVLLTGTFDAMLADFGLSRLIADDTPWVTLTMAGTPGYVAPEVIQTGRVDDKADVYSFGVLLLEVACGQQALDPSNSQYSRLVDRIWLRHQQASILDVLDPQIVYSQVGGAVPTSSSGAASLVSSSASLASSSSSTFADPTGSLVQGPVAPSGNYSDHAADHGLEKWRCVLYLGLLCCQYHSNARPRMREVHQALKECRVLPPPESWVSYPAAGAAPAAGSAGDQAGRT